MLRFIYEVLLILFCTPAFLHTHLPWIDMTARTMDHGFRHNIIQLRVLCQEFQRILSHRHTRMHAACMQAAYDRNTIVCSMRRRPAFYGVDAGMQIVIIRHE